MNPYANRGGGAKSRAIVAQAFAQAGVTIDLVETKGRGDAIGLAQSARLEGYATVVAAGGDGTVSEVVNGLMQPMETGSMLPPLPLLGILPIGAGNDFAHVLGYPRDLAQTAQRIAAGQARQIDLGQLTLGEGAQRQVRYFINSLGVGLEAHVTVVSERITRLRGALRYLVAAVRAVGSYHSTLMTLSCEAADAPSVTYRGDTLMVTVGNSPRSGGGFYLTPDARPDDGSLDVAIARAVPTWRIFLLLPRARSGRHIHDPAVTMMQGQRISITAEGCPVHADGEILDHAATRLEICLLPQRLAVIDPADSLGFCFAR